MVILQESWGICYFRSPELAAAAYEANIEFHNGLRAVFRLLMYMVIFTLGTEHVGHLGM